MFVDITLDMTTTHKYPTQALAQEPPLRHKLPAVAAASRPADYNTNTVEMEEVKVEGVAANYRQQLNPVAMPGSTPRSSALLTGLPAVSAMGAMPPTGAMPPMTKPAGPAPEVPVRSPHKSSLLQSTTLPSLPSRHPVQRPLSDLSLLSEFTQGEAASVTTRQSVNEILSLAEVSTVCSSETLDNLDALDYYLQGWKFMSCIHCQELCQQASWLLIGCTRVNNQSEARTQLLT